METTWFKFADLPDGLKAIAKVREITWSPKVGDKGLAELLNPYRGNDNLRPVMSHVYADERGFTATDAHKVIHIPAEVPEAQHGMFTIEWKPNNEGRYPNYYAVVPQKNPRKYTLDLLRLESYAKAALHYSNKTTHQIPLTDRKDDFGISMNGNFLLTVIKTLRQMGHDHADLHCSQPNRAMVFTPVGHAVLESVSVLMMPVMRNDDTSEYQHFPIDPDFEIGLGSGYDLRTNTIFNHDGTETTTWQVMEGWQPSGNVTRDRLMLIRSIADGKNRIPIASYAMVQNGVLYCTNLKTHYTMPKCGLADGFYVPETEGLKPTSINGDNPDPFDNFPIPHTFVSGNVLKWGVQELADRLDIADIITSNDDLRPQFNGYNLQVQSGTLTFGSTDHYSVYYDRCKVPYTITDFNVTLDSVRRQKMFAAMFKTGHIFMQLAEKYYQLLGDTGERLTGGYIDEKYPALPPVIEKHTRAEYDRAIIIDKKEVDTLEPIMRKEEAMTLHLPATGTTAKLTLVIEDANKKREYKDAKDMPMRIVDMAAPNDKLVISFPVHGTVEDRPWIGIGKTVMQTLKKLFVGRAATDFTLHYPSSSEGVALIVTNPTLPDWPDDHLLGSAPQSMGVKVPTPPRAKTPPKQTSLAEVVEVVKVEPLEVKADKQMITDYLKNVKPDLLASAPTLDAIQKQIAKFFHSENISLHPVNNEPVWAVYNLKGIIDSVRVVKIKGRYRFEMLPKGFGMPDVKAKAETPSTPDPIAIRARAAATALRLKLKLMQMKY